MGLKKNIGNMTEMLMKKRFWATICTVVFALVLAFNLSGCTSGGGSDNPEDASVPNDAETISIDDEGAGSDSTTSIDIPQDSEMDKMVSVSVENLGRANPFLPPGEVAYASKLNVPKEHLEYDVLPPLESPQPDMAARKVASTKVSGIMYDKSSPSAILNIEGLDYLVRSGDVINGYKVLSIDKSMVTVQVGSNIYKAGVGQAVGESGNGINYNQVANLHSKFGGNKK